MVQPARMLIRQFYIPEQIPIKAAIKVHFHYYKIQKNKNVKNQYKNRRSFQRIFFRTISKTGWKIKRMKNKITH